MTRQDADPPEPQFRRFVEQSAAGIWHVDREGRTVFANPAMLAMLQVSTLGELTGVTYHRFFSEESLAIIAREQETRAANEASIYEAELIGQLGRRLLVAVNGEPLFEDAGHSGTIGTFIDITEAKLARRKAEDDLARANRRLLVHLEETPLGMLECDTSLRILRWSRPAEKMFGWTSEEMIGTTFTEHPLVHGDDADLVRQRVESLIAGRALSTQHANRNRTKDGRILICEWHSSVVKNERGDIESILGIAHDVTQQEQAEEAVRESQRMLFTLLGNLPGMAYRCRADSTWTMEFVSEGCRDLTGYSAAEIIGNKLLSFENVIHPEDRTVVRQQIDAALTRYQQFELNYRIMPRDGNVRWVWERGTGVFDREGRILCIEGFITDITRQKRLEEDLRHSQKMECVGRLAGGVAHDFNNILTVIQGHASLIGEMSAESDMVRDSAREVCLAVDRASNLTRQLLTFSRRQAMQARDVDLNDVLADMLKMLARLLGADISCQFSPAPFPATIHADAGMLHQILMNLAVNARDAMPSGGVLSIRIQNAELNEAYVQDHPEAGVGQFVMLEVTDTGCGIAPNHLARLFEPFFTTKDVGKGTGLGLATVYGIVEQHRGWINVQSELGAGTSFQIYFPAIEPKPVPAFGARVPEQVRGGNETIMVVEDERELLALVQNILKASGYRIVAARSGAAALVLWKQVGEQIDLLLTDLVMPDGINGRELAEQLCAEKPGLRTIFTSGYSPQVMGHDFVLQARQRYLQKPYSPSDLTAIVRACLDTD